MTDTAPKTTPASVTEPSPIAYWERVETALTRTQWALDSHHLSQAALIRRLTDLPLKDYMGCHKSESTIKSYLQGNLPKTSPDLIDGLMAAVAVCFQVEVDLFFDKEISRERFSETIRGAGCAPARKLAALEAENRALKEKLEKLKGRKDLGLRHAVAKFSMRRIRPKPLVGLGAILSLLLGGALLWGFGGPEAPYPPRRAAEITSALLDGRDLLLNTPETPMQVAYGSQLCVEMATPRYYASAFVADNGFYFNQEGRPLLVPHGEMPACTGVWPGIPGTFRATPYQLFIVTSEARLPVSGDGDRLERLPEGSYFGPIYIQRTD